ncbi:hypothetical protein, partial [Gluconobacter cerinus]|uniref:hypothetical protein n=1 Tax=Gluconobacter cerinus TaxID=38307 RepID=UPI001C03BAA3
YNLYLDKVEALGLNKDNVYRFIRGHELEEKIVMPLLECLKFKILNAEISAIESENHRSITIKEETKKKINNFFSNKLDLETIICNDYSFKEDYIFNKIKEKFSNALET